MDDQEIICICMSVSVKDIKKAIEEGASTFQEIQDKTGAGTVCGVCNEDLMSTVTQLLNENRIEK